MSPNVASELYFPKIIETQICRQKPHVPTNSEAWRQLHRRHVSRLHSAYGALLAKLGIDGILIHSGVSLKKNSQDDQYWPTNPTPMFTHWTPYQETPALLALKTESKPKLYFEEHSSFWEGAAPTSENWDRDSFDLENVSDLDGLKFKGSWAFVGDDIGLANKLGIPVEQRNRNDVLSTLDQFRTLKSEFEVASIAAANQAALLGHQKLFELFTAGDVSELDLHYEYLRITRQTDINVAYNDIVAIGSNCGILHHVHYGDQKVKGDTSLLIDAGVLCNGYASDITRTWVRGKSADAKLFQDLLTRVDVVQQQIVSEFKVGHSYEALHNRCHGLLAKVLVDIGLAKSASEDLVESGVTRLFFPHGLGHSLGIQVHDVGMRLTSPAKNNPYLRNTSVIKAGQVVTIEPGIYFIPTLMQELSKNHLAQSIDWKMIDALRPFGGIRIEDNILATSDGPINLTR